MKKTTQSGHGGDVQFKAILSLPANAKPIKNVPLAYGEKSGHIHVITGDVELFEVEGSYFAKIGEKGACLQHVHESNFKNEDYISTKEIQKADHNSIVIEPNQIIEFGIHKKYDPFQKVWEKVID